MAPLVVDGVARFTVNATYADRPVANILDMDIDTATGTTRAEACLDQAKVIVSNWVDHVMGNLCDRYHALNVAWVDMNSLEGSTGEAVDGTTSDFPHFGTLTSPGFPGSVSALIHKQLTAGRGSRQGRMYLPGLREAETDHDSPNTIAAGTVTDINTGFAAFLSGINQEPGLGGTGYESNLVVVHTSHRDEDGDPITEPRYVGKSRVTALKCDPILASQRRRLR